MCEPKAPTELVNAYEELLEEHGLDRVAVSERASRESAAAMKNAGWYEDAPHELRVQYEARRGRDVARAYNPMLASIAGNVESALKTLGITQRPSVFVGGFPLGESNARVEIVRGGALILFNHGLIQFLYQLGKVFVLSYDWLCALSSDELEVEVRVHDGEPSEQTMSEVLGWEKCLWTREDTRRALNNLLQAYVRSGSVTASNRQPLPTGKRALTLASIVEYAERFIVAHEYAHVVLGHCDAEETELATPVGLVRVAAITSRQDEFDADEFATRLLLAEGMDISTPEGEFDANARIAGIAIAFASAILTDVAKQGQEGLGYFADESDGHPAPNTRLVRLIDYIHKEYSRSLTQLARVCMGWLMASATELVEGLTNLSEANRLEDDGQRMYEERRFADASRRFRRVIELRERALGETHWSLAAPLSNLASSLSDMGETEEVESLYERAVQICDHAGSLAGDQLAIGHHNLATHYASVGKVNAAKEMFARSLEHAEEYLAEDIDALNIVVNSYTSFLMELNLTREAEEICMRAVRVVEEVFGPKHVDARGQRVRLLEFYEHTSQFDKAIPVSREVVDVTRGLFGERHSEFATAVSNLAYVYLYARHFSEAWTTLVRALELTRDSDGEDHPAFAAVRHNMGLLHEARKEYELAEAAFSEAASIMVRHEGADHSKTQASLAGIERVKSTDGPST